MKNLKSHFVFSRNQQNGIFLLVVIIFGLQMLYFFGNFGSTSETYSDEPELIVFQQRIDSIKKATTTGDTLRIFPFNPNFITDYRGYTLGMSIDEIDRLHRYRAGEKWVNTTSEFQQVTGVSDSLLNEIAPYFRFPDWVTTNPPKTISGNNVKTNVASATEKMDLNSASVEDLMTVKGIGETLAGRIVNYRNKIGGFINDIQLKDIYGLNFEVREEVLKQFAVKNPATVERLNINTVGVLELSAVPYINYELAREIVNYRLLHEKIVSFEELAKIKDFPSEKIERIALYLTLK